MKKSFFRFCSVAVLCVLLLSPAAATQGAQNGLVLWATVVLPTLLPFMICSNVIVALDAIHILTFPFRGFLRNFLKLSDAGSYILVSGLLCGYPMGARNCSDFLDGERITKAEARYLLSICNHPSPMFLLGYAASELPGAVPVWMLMAAVYLPVVLIAWLSRKLYGIQTVSPSLPYSREAQLTFDESLMDSCEVMVKIGGYIMLFSILVFYITELPLHNPAGKAALLGFVEITTGIRAISSSIPSMAGGMWIAAATAFGGLSGIFQTKSVIKNAGLSIRHYVAWKAVHSLLSAAIFILLACCRQLPWAA